MATRSPPRSTLRYPPTFHGELIPGDDRAVDDSEDVNRCRTATTTTSDFRAGVGHGNDDLPGASTTCDLFDFHFLATDLEPALTPGQRNNGGFRTIVCSTARTTLALVTVGALGAVWATPPSAGEEHRSTDETGLNEVATVPDLRSGRPPRDGDDRPFLWNLDKSNTGYQAKVSIHPSTDPAVK